MCNDERYFYTFALALMIIFFTLFVLVDFFAMRWVTVGFIIFGIPVVGLTAAFWVEVIEKLFIK